MFNRTTVLVLVAALAAALGLWAAQRWSGGQPAPSMQAVKLFEQPRALPAFSLQQSDGTRLVPGELKGHWTVVFLGFTHCPDVCPTTLAQLAQAQKRWAALPEATRPRVLFVSVDPERDTPVKAGEYAAFFHPATLAATASTPVLEDFAASLGMVFMPVQTPAGDVTFDHSTGVVLVDPQGRQAGLIRPPLVPADIAADLRALVEATP